MEDMYFYLAVDEDDVLFIHPITDINDERLLEIVCGNHKKFHTLSRGRYNLYSLGKYIGGSVVHVYHEGIEIFKERLPVDINNLGKPNIKSKKDAPREVNVNFIDGPFVEIKDNEENKYRVEFIDLKTGMVDYGVDLKTNHWCGAAKKYKIDWLVTIKGIDNDFYYEHRFNVAGRRVLISFESKSLGDTLAWFPQVERFRIENTCTVICSTFHNKLFKDQYPDIQFVEPGSTVEDIYSLFRIGLFRKGIEIDLYMHREDPLPIPLGKICSDILGMDYVELKPHLPIFTTKKKKVVSIATHGTAQCKYWNNPTGWQDVVNYIVSKGYKVKLLSREEDGYMGNKNPKNVTKIRPGSIENIMTIIQESELFIGLSSGLSWLSWAVGTETILISGFTDAQTEPMNGVERIINENVCHGCWSRHKFDAGDWNWCPDHKGTDRQFECTREITSEQVITEIKKVIG